MKIRSQKINLYGGPGIGKSTVAFLLSAELKLKEQRVELVTEYAKELVYLGIDLTKSNQNLQDQIMLEQLKRELVFQDQVDFMVCDSPLLLNAFYNGSENALKMSRTYLRDNDYHFFLTRTQEHFETEGRSHNEEQSIKIDKKMEQFFKDHKIKYIKIDGNSKEKVAEILKILGL